MRRQATM
jgi:ABC-type oligopeptide transport system ATPase subunit